MSFRLSPGCSDTTSDVWNIQEGYPHNDSVNGYTDTGHNYSMRLDAGFGYRLPAPRWFFDGRGTLSPYTEITLGEHSESYRLGIELDLVGETGNVIDRNANDPVGKTIPLEGSMRFLFPSLVCPLSAPKREAISRKLRENNEHYP